MGGKPGRAHAKKKMWMSLSVKYTTSIPHTYSIIHIAALNSSGKIKHTTLISSILIVVYSFKWYRFWTM